MLNARHFAVDHESEYVAATRCRPYTKRLSRSSVQYIKRLTEDLDRTQYQEVEKHFREQWTKTTHDYPVPPIPVVIYAIQNDVLTNKYRQYKQKTFGDSSEPNEEWHFHGTSIKCDIINSDKCCTDKTCGVCGISRNGFDLSFTKNAYQRFGKGIYLAPNSSKSNAYPTGKSLNPQLLYGYKAQLLCLVACGNKHILYDDDRSLVAPPANCHSVYGKASTDGKLNYDEVVVYNADAINPQFVIVYSKGVESIASGIQRVAVSHQPWKKPNAVTDKQNTQSNAQYSQLRTLRNADRTSLSAAYDVTHNNRSQYMYNQSSVRSSGGVSNYAALMSEHKTNSGMHKRESQCHNAYDRFRSSASARRGSGYVTPHKMGDMQQKSIAKDQYVYDQSKISSVRKISKHTKLVSELEVGASKLKTKSSNNHSSRGSPSSGGKYGSHSATSRSEREMKKQKNEDSHDQSWIWNSYVFEGISNLFNSVWSGHNAIESKPKSEYDHSRSSSSLLERKVASGKQKRESRYDYSRSSPAKRLYGYATLSSENRMHAVGGDKQKSKSQSMHDQSRRSSPSVGGISRCATPLSEHGTGGSKQRSKVYDRSKSLPSPAKEISCWATPSSGSDGKQKQHNYLSSAGRILRHGASSLDHKVDDSKQKTKGHYDQPSSVKRFSRYATPQSERQVHVGVAKSQNDRSRKSPSSGVKSGCDITNQNMKLTTKGPRTRSRWAN